MNIPAQVQAQADRADELLKGSGKPENIEHTEGKKPEDAVINPPVETETVETLKHKLSVLQGKYNSEVQALKQDVTLLSTLKNQVRQLTGQLNESNLLVSDLQKRITEKPKPAEVATTDGKLTEADREYLKTEGFDDPDKLFEIFGKVRGQSISQPPPVDREEIVGQVKKEITQENLEARFWAKLDENIKDESGQPDWDPINGRDDFNDWLDQAGRRYALKGAQAALDYQAVIQIFNDFKKTLSPAGGLTPPKPESQIEPSTSVARTETPSGEIPAGKIYTRKEVNEFYKGYKIRAARGMDTKQDQATDQDILRAQAEGRIRD